MTVIDRERDQRRERSSVIEVRTGNLRISRYSDISILEGIKSTSAILVASVWCFENS